VIRKPALPVDAILPEVLAILLSQLLVSIQAMKIAHLDDLDWLNAPPTT
jgi:ATP-dependent helicase HrpB